MKTENPFDRHLSVGSGQIPQHILDAAVHTTDKLHIAWISAQIIFKDKATPDVALAIYDRLDKVIDAEKAATHTAHSLI